MWKRSGASQGAIAVVSSLFMSATSTLPNPVESGHCPEPERVESGRYPEQPRRKKLDIDSKREDGSASRPFCVDDYRDNDHDDEVNGQSNASDRLAPCGNAHGMDDESDTATVVASATAPRTRQRIPWTAHEDAIITKLVTSSSDGPFTRWQDLVQHLPGRDRGQIRYRWINGLDPKLSHREFSKEDDLTLYEGYEELGSRWRDIATKYFGSSRSDTQIRNRWKSPAFELLKNDPGFLKECREKRTIRDGKNMVSTDNVQQPDSRLRNTGHSVGMDPSVDADHAPASASAAGAPPLATSVSLREEHAAAVPPPKSSTAASSRPVRAAARSRPMYQEHFEDSTDDDFDEDYIDGDENNDRKPAAKSGDLVGDPVSALRKVGRRSSASHLGKRPSQGGPSPVNGKISCRLSLSTTASELPSTEDHSPAQPTIGLPAPSTAKARSSPTGHPKGGNSSLAQRMISSPGSKSAPVSEQLEVASSASLADASPSEHEPSTSTDPTRTLCATSCPAPAPADPVAPENPSFGVVDSVLPATGSATASRLVVNGTALSLVVLPASEGLDSAASERPTNTDPSPTRSAMPSPALDSASAVPGADTGSTRSEEWTCPNAVALGGAAADSGVADLPDPEEAVAIAATAEALFDYLFDVLYEGNDEMLDEEEICDLNRAVKLRNDRALVQRFVRIYRVHQRGTDDAIACSARDGSGDENGFFLRGCARRFVEFARRRERKGLDRVSARTSSAQN